ncbi:hypothetical protein ACFXJ8_22940 [Nonomuraea sp. NPDC059194]|uniref:hypothetical protein n=1 Tax=Nonomuraea sp. NPDC059194 TaxID=3346764 RepID=UPI003683A89B
MDALRRVRVRAFIEKNLRSLAPITLGGRPYKRYHVDREGHEIEPEVEKAAYAYAPRTTRPRGGCTGAATAAPTCWSTRGCGTT